MYFRCPVCLSATWLDRLEPVRTCEALDCAKCEASFEASPIANLGATIGDHYQRSLKLSNDKQIDMPTAYSVVLGLLTLDDVRRFQGLVTPATEAPRQEKRGHEGALLLDLDPGFQKAVTDGCLTIQEAIRRGNREAHAAGLARRHGLSRDLACRVTDNRISLHEALRRKPASPRQPPRKRPVTSLQRRTVLGVALLIVVAVTWSVWSANFESVRGPERTELRRIPPPAPRIVSPAPGPRSTDKPNPASVTAVETDSMGRVTRVVGPDPDAVLAAFCAHGGPFVSKQPIDITPTKPRSPDARLGIYRDLDSLAADQTIRIRRDARTRRWVAGDGEHPIFGADAPASDSRDLQASAFAGSSRPTAPDQNEPLSPRR